METLCIKMETLYQLHQSMPSLQLLLLHPFNGLFSKTTWVSQHQKGKPFWILLEQELMGWQWHQLDHVQVICTSLQTTPHHSLISDIAVLVLKRDVKLQPTNLTTQIFTGRVPFLPLNQQRQSTEGILFHLSN